MTLAAYDIPPATTWVCDWCGREEVVPSGGYFPETWKAWRWGALVQHQCDRCSPGGYAAQPTPDAEEER